MSLLHTQGMTVTELTPDEVNKLRAKTAPVYAERSPKVGESIIQQFQAR